MIGAGIFINAKPLTQLAGPFGFMGYLIGACILLPLILCIAELANLHSVAGGLYVYPRTYLNPSVGFLSGWAYFIGKTTSAAVLMHKFNEFFVARVPVLQNVSPLMFDIGMLFLIAGLNIAGLAIGGRIQYVITALKAVPILAIFTIGFCYFDSSAFYHEIIAGDLFNILPIALFALSGFEAVCHIGNMIDQSKHSIKWVIVTSFSIVAAVNILFQIFAYSVLGDVLTTTSEPILTIGLTALPSVPWFAAILNGAVFTAIIGSCFSILTSNCWNLHAMAKDGHLPFKNLLTRVNQQNTPWISLLIEVALGSLILVITLNQVPLQNMAVLSQQTAFFLCACAALRAVQRKALRTLAWWVPVLALMACGSIMGICVYRLIALGVSASFVTLFSTGLIAKALTGYLRPKRQ